MRNQRGRSWRAKLALYVASGTTAGAAAGALAGALGSAIPAAERATAAVVLGAAGLVVGLMGLRGHVSVPQRDCATPQRWLHEGPLTWALKNGASLGFGASTRLGFALWFVVPLAGVLSGDVFLGAGIWAVYGSTRTLAAWPLMVALGRGDGLAKMDWLARDGARYARLATTGALIAISCVTLFVAGP